MEAQKKRACAKEGCSDKPVRIVGHCKFCEKDYCGKHRQVETHQCPNIDACRQQHFEKNSAKLMGEKTITSKFQQAM